MITPYLKDGISSLGVFIGKINDEKMKVIKSLFPDGGLENVDGKEFLAKLKSKAITNDDSLKQMYLTDGAVQFGLKQMFDKDQNCNQILNG